MFIDPDFLRYNFSIVLTSYKELILKVVVGNFYYFGPKVIEKSVVNKHCIFHSHNSFLSLFNMTNFFIYA